MWILEGIIWRQTGHPTIVGWSKTAILITSILSSEYSEIKPKYGNIPYSPFTDPEVDELQ